MSLRRKVLVPLAVLACGCFPYKNHDGDYAAGPIDPKNFPPAYQGMGFAQAGNFGTFMAAPASAAGGKAVAYYMFPVTMGITKPTVLRTESTDPKTNITTIKDRAPVYVFDGDESLDTKKCVAPKDYIYDQRRDDVRYDVQGNVFQQKQTSKDPPSLPSDAAYVPIYAEVPVTSVSEGCQTLHSADGVVASGSGVTLMTDPAPIGSPDFRPVGHPDGKYIAYAVIDPAADVHLPDGSLDPNTGLGPQRFGWFDHFLVAYIDGGYVPNKAQTVPGMNGAPDQKLIVADSMTLYAPNAWVDPNTMMPNGCSGMDPIGAGGGQSCIGQGFDVIDGIGGKPGIRGDAGMGYSPICHVLTYTPADPAAPATDPTMIDPTTVDPDSGTFVYCLQVAQ
jgi:hypothetical protein